jgi:hypothetical protein
VKPEPVEIRDIPGNKYTVDKGASERISIHLGFPRSIDYLVGTVTVVAPTDGGDKVKSKLVKMTICNP